MKKLLVYLKDYRKEAVLAPAFKLIEASFELLVPLVMAAMIDTGIANRDVSYVWKMFAVLVALGLVGLLCAVCAQYFAAKAAVGFSAKLKHALFAHIQSLSYAEMDTLGTATMITRMTSDANQVQSGVNLVLRLFLRSPFIVFGAMIMALFVDVKAAMVFVVAIPVLCAAVFAVMLASIPLFSRVQKRLDSVLGTTRENLTGVRVIRAFGKEQDEIDTFEQQNLALEKLQQFAGRVSALMNPLTYVIINAATAALLWRGAIRVDTGIITQGALVALVNYMSQILVELIKLANLIITITKSAASAKRIESVFDTEPSIYGGTAPAPAPGAAAVDFENVSLRYGQAGDDSLQNVTFHASPGQTVGIIGATGAGKTSLVNLIGRFYDATAGRVMVDGVDVCAYSMEALREKIAVVPQKAVLFKGTIRENLAWGNPSASDDALLAALETAQAKAFVLEKEGGLDAPVEQGGRNFSGGQRQRLTIARALVKNAGILILDDSASALDLATDAALRRAIRAMPTPPTTFIVSQRTSSIRFADLIVVLEDGCVVGLGTHDELLAHCGVYQEIYYSQYPKEGAGV